MTSKNYVEGEGSTPRLLGTVLMLWPKAIRCQIMHYSKSSL